MTNEDLNRLIEKYLSGQATPDEERLIDDFFHRRESRRALPHYKVSEDMWAAIQKAITTRPMLGTDRTKSRPATRRKVAVAIAAALLLVVLSLAAVHYSEWSTDARVAWVTYECPNGQKSLITLADGSRIFLNSASTISYPETFESGKREIKLSGEAYFEIAHDENRPLTVRSGDLLTTVLGTSFNIEAFEGETARVTVATGKVQVEVQGDADSTDRVVLTPNQQAVYHSGQKSEVRTVSAEKFVGWKDQVLFFDDNTLEEAVAKIERWYNVSIGFETDTIKHCRINGQYKQVDLRSVLESIAYMYDIDYEFTDRNRIVLRGKGCA
jgi:ferric-dicitrate binding protein FerR (iron transport regulator)